LSVAAKFEPRTMIVSPPSTVVRLGTRRVIDAVATYSKLWISRSPKSCVSVSKTPNVTFVGLRGGAVNVMLVVVVSWMLTGTSAPSIWMPILPGRNPAPSIVIGKPPADVPMFGSIVFASGGSTTWNADAFTAVWPEDVWTTTS
jgi:hypothetical protein